MRLNLGCGDVELDGWIGVDIVGPADEIEDLSGPWPWPDSSVEEIRAHDIFEHLPNKIHTMNEAWRVLVPGGKLDLFVPTTDGRGAFQDPQHASYWTPNDLFYYCDGYEERKSFRARYGITARFKVLSEQHTEFPDEVWKLRALLEALKDAKS